MEDNYCSLTTDFCARSLYFKLYPIPYFEHFYLCLALNPFTLCLVCLFCYVGHDSKEGNLELK